jgi:outer membrane protein assembly factor BamB
MCIARDSGRIVRDVVVDAARPDHGYGGFLHEHGYASSTPVSDGERVYTYFGNSGAYAFDSAGEQIWHADCGDQQHGFGSGASPILFENLLIVNASIESGRLLALDKLTGNIVWEAVEIVDAWNTPVIVPAGERSQLVIATRDDLRAFDPATGELLWRWNGSNEPTYVCPSLVVHDGTIIGMASHRGPLVAASPTAQGRGDDAHAVWRSKSWFMTTVVSPVCSGSHVYYPHDNEGTMACFAASTGEELDRIRPEPHWGNLYASPLAADGKIYVVSRWEGTYIFEATPEMRQIARNQIASDKTQFNASPVPIPGRLLLRSEAAVYCVGAAP